MITIFTQENDQLFLNIANCAFSTLGLSGDASVELVFMDEEDIRKLNYETRKIDKSTDVLSYPNLNEIKPFTHENYPVDYNIDTKTVFLGSIVICETIAKAQAEEYGHSIERERAYLFLHGILHLLGYDHENEEDKNVMREKEELILTALGVMR